MKQKNALLALAVLLILLVVIGMFFSPAKKILSHTVQELGGYNQDDVVIADPSHVIVADFGVVEYFPNLKTKIGFSTNAKNAILSAARKQINEIGPGMMCSNIEFDMWFKHGEDAMDNAALVQTADAAGRPVVTNSNPSPWLVGYEKLIGDLQVSQMLQITGAPAQYQSTRFVDTGRNISVHPSPSDVTAAAQFMGQWTATEKHSYPILWSFWNEPGHTFMGIMRTRNEYGEVVLPEEGAKEFAIRKAQESTKNSTAFAKLYAVNEAQIRSHTNTYSQLGLASFLSADFNPYDLDADQKIYFKAVVDTLQTSYPTAKINYITFNNFNGGWPVSISGARTVLGSRKDIGPFIITQYSPGSLKVSENGDVTGDQISPVGVAAEMLTDIAQLEKATDVQTMCMSYWIGGKYGFLSEGTNNTVTENPRYTAIALFAQLPTVRTKLDFGTSQLEEQGVHGLAGKNQSKASVLLWNEGDKNIAVPLSFLQLPGALASAVPSVTLLTNAGLQKSTSLYKNGIITLPANSIALIEKSSLNVSDPLLRRNAIASDGAQPTRFLQTKVTVDRVPFACTKVTTIPGITSCSKNTGTYGFYDSVRSIAYLGRGEGAAAATVTATYENIPSKLYVNIQVFAQDTANIVKESLPVVSTAFFPACNKTVTATTNTPGYGIFDFVSAQVPDLCRIDKPVILTFVIPGSAASGTQAEVFISSDSAAASVLAQNNTPLSVRTSPIDVAEHLVVDPFFNQDTGTVKEIIEAMRLTVLQSCPKNDLSCPLYTTGTLSLVAADGKEVSTFQPKSGSVVLKAVDGTYSIQTTSKKTCTELKGKVETSKGVINEVTVVCPAS